MTWACAVLQSEYSVAAIVTAVSRSKPRGPCITERSPPPFQTAKRVNELLSPTY